MERDFWNGIRPLGHVALLVSPKDFWMIDYLDARYGGIEMFVGDKSVGWAKTPTAIACIMKRCGVADTVYGSSSMDFAAEYGFETNDGASLLLKRALELIWMFDEYGNYIPNDEEAIEFEEFDMEDE